MDAEGRHLKLCSVEFDKIKAVLLVYNERFFMGFSSITYITANTSIGIIDVMPATSDG